MKVLLADDEPFYLDWLVDYLESKSVEVEIATTVDDAIIKVANNSYRFIVVDLNIPVLKDGSKYSKHITGAYIGPHFVLCAILGSNPPITPYDWNVQTLPRTARIP